MNYYLKQLEKAIIFIETNLCENKARGIAQWRQKASIDFYESLYNEVLASHKKGSNLLREAFEKDNS